MSLVTGGRGAAEKIVRVAENLPAIARPSQNHTARGNNE
jgi:hypothetical protein